MTPAFAHSPERPLPKRASVVVIGGGVAGVTAALTLAEWGLPVVLCEKGRIAGEQSSRNWGWIRKQGRDIRELPLMIESQQLWRRIDAQLESDIGLRGGGSTYLAESEAELARHAAWLEQAKGFQLDTRLLSRAEVNALLAQSDAPFVGGLHTPSDIYAEPTRAVPAVARLAADAGAEIFEGTAVRTLETAGGRIAAVVTEHGAIACEAVVLAGGVWSRPFLENLGLALPQLAVQSSAQRTTPAPLISDSTLGASAAALRRRLDGGYTVARAGAARFDIVPAAFTHFRAFTPILKARRRMLKLRLGRAYFGPLGRHRWQGDQVTPFEAIRVFDPAPDHRLLDDVLQAAKRLYPQLAEVKAVERWGGMIDVMPDEIPVIGPAGSLPGLVIATGLSGHGFGLGPGVGKLAAQLATGRPTLVDPAPFRYDRFGGTA